MSNIHKRNGLIIATYNNKEYKFKTIIELLIAVSTVKNIQKINTI
ncbi:hypothetical protein [Anaerocolumna aminovalerica]|nr:hypothetical protein [Anaerocolumna aminovalerica]